MSDKGEFEMTDDVHVHEGRKAGMTVSVRLKPDEAEELVALSRRYDTTLSETLRLAVRSLMSATDYATLKNQRTGVGSFARVRTEAEVDELITVGGGTS
jgi:hypothetical protein